MARIAHPLMVCFVLCVDFSCFLKHTHIGKTQTKLSAAVYVWGRHRRKLTRFILCVHFVYVCCAFYLSSFYFYGIIICCTFNQPHIITHTHSHALLRPQSILFSFQRPINQSKIKSNTLWGCKFTTFQPTKQLHTHVRAHISQYK